MKRNILQIIGVYLGLVIMSTVIFHDFSPRYTIFLLIDAILLVTSAKVFSEEKGYYEAIGVGLLLGSSLFAIRYLTVSMPKIAEVDILFSYIFAICNFMILILSMFSNKILKNIMFAGGGHVYSFR